MNESPEQILSVEQATALLSEQRIQHTLQEMRGCLIASTMRRHELLAMLAEPDCKITAASGRWATVGYRITVQRPGAGPLHVHASSEIRW